MGELVIDAYAHFHGFWWEHAWLGQRVGALLTEATIDEAIETAQAKLADIVRTVGDEIKPAQYDVLDTVVSAWPTRRRQRVIAEVGVTLVHRDPHPLNFLYPYDSDNNPVKLIDWQSWRVDTGTDDLAYLMACHWPLEEIERVEQALVQRARCARTGRYNTRQAICQADGPRHSSLVRQASARGAGHQPADVTVDGWRALSAL